MLIRRLLNTPYHPLLGKTLLVCCVLFMVLVLSGCNVSIEIVTPTPPQTPSNTPMPTLTLTPSPTFTQTQTLSPTPVHTSTPLASPTHTHTSTPEGWVRHTAGEIEIWLPNGWEEWEVTKDTLDIVIEALQEMNSQFVGVIEELLEQPEMMETLRLFAFDTEGMGAQMNITADTLPIPININDFGLIMIQLYEELGAQDISITIVEINGLKAALIQYDLPMEIPEYGTFISKNIQYFVLKGQIAYGITFSTDPQEFPTLLPTIEQIVNSFRIND